MNTASSLLSAIESGDLDATSEGIMIVLKINDQAFCRLACLRSGCPTASVVDGSVVRILPSPGIRDGFQITCESWEDAIEISEALQSLIDCEYSHVFDCGSSRQQNE